MKLGIFATHEPYRHHLDPIWEALSPDERVVYGTSSSRELQGLDADVWLAAAYSDFQVLRRTLQPRAYMEHGTGLQWYPQREVKHIAQAAVVLSPNERIAERYRAFEKRLRVEVIGTPKLDELLRIRTTNTTPVVAVSFHWTGWRAVDPIQPTLERFRKAICDLNARMPVIGHAHPRVWDKAARRYLELGIEPVRSFDEVVRRADLYVCDHSSTLYEWAALDRPVVMLKTDSRLVPRASGLRYTTFNDIGPQAKPEELVDVVLEALNDDSYAEARAAATEALYPYLGRSTERAVEILRDVASTRGA